MKYNYIRFFFIMVIAIFYFQVNLIAQSTGLLKLTIQDKNGVTDSISFGELQGATPFLDIALGEFEIPPTPPSGAFDIRWIVPDVEGLLIDYRDTINAQNINNVWTLKFQPSSSGYPVSITWDTTKLWNGFFNMYDAETGGTKTNVDMSMQGGITISDPGINSLNITHIFTVDRNISLQAGWNLVSVPVEIKDWNAVEVFPGYISAYSYSGGYQITDTLTHGKGYWVNYPNSAIVGMTGKPLANDTFEVVSGWNLIGSTFSTVATASIQQVPGSIINSYFFSYSNGYKLTTNISPGQGIWVKTSQAGKLILYSTSLFKSSEQIPMIDFSEWNTIKITDVNGASGELFFSAESKNIEQFDMPPKSPIGVFDIRFAGDKFAGVLLDTSSNLKIELQGTESPLKIEWNVRDNITYVLNGRSIDPILVKGEGFITLENLNNSIELKVIFDNESIYLPKEFKLSQNYPNPFNPSTTIKFALPERARVNLTIYNILGERVAEIINEELDAGYYEKQWNASGFASGVYLYRIIAGSFVETKKLLILK